MDAAMPLEPDPFAALTRRFAAIDAAQEAHHKKGEEVLKNGKAAMARLKKSAEINANGDSPSRTRICVKAFAESDLERCEAIEEAAEQQVREEAPRIPITEVLDSKEVLARLNSARAKVSGGSPVPD